MLCWICWWRMRFESIRPSSVALAVNCDRGRVPPVTRLPGGERGPWWREGDASNNWAVRRWPVRGWLADPYSLNHPCNTHVEVVELGFFYHKTSRSHVGGPPTNSIFGSRKSAWKQGDIVDMWGSLCAWGSDIVGFRWRIQVWGRRNNYGGVEQMVKKKGVNLDCSLFLSQLYVLACNYSF